MNAALLVLLLLSVAASASALAIGNQNLYEENLDLDGRELQKQDKYNLPPWLAPADQRSEIAEQEQAIQLPYDVADSVAIQPMDSQLSEQLAVDARGQETGEENLQQDDEELSALEQRNEVAPGRVCEAVKECQVWNTIRVCKFHFFVCWIHEDERTTCARWVIRNQCKHQRGEIEGSPFQGEGSDTASDDSPRERAVTDDSQVVTGDEQKTVIAALQSESMITFRNVYNQKVVKAEKYDPLVSKPPGGDVTSRGEKATTVIVTLVDGRRFAIVQGRGLFRSGASAIVSASHVTDDWKLVKSKEIKFSKVSDFVRVSDSTKDSKEAADKMMALI